MNELWQNPCFRRTGILFPAVAALVVSLTSACSGPMVTYNTSDWVVSQQARLSNQTLNVNFLQDARRQNPLNRPAFDRKTPTDVNHRKVCVNSEHRYEGGNVAAQVTRMIAAHIRAEKVFAAVSTGNPAYGDLQMSGVLQLFYGQQDVNYTDVVGAVLGGLIGSAIASSAKSMGIVQIQITGIEIHDRSGRLIGRLPDISGSFQGEYPADSDCRRIYHHVNNALGKLVSRWLPRLKDAVRGGFVLPPASPSSSPAVAGSPPPFLVVSAPRSRPAGPDEQLLAACSEGLQFLEDRCVSPCNPPCGENETCTRRGFCIPAR